MANNKGLGRGLGALILTAEEDYNITPVNSERVLSLEVTKIKPNKKQPRKKFEKEKIEELSNSIKEHGVIQPLIVVEDKGNYQIVAGERRYRAALMAGLKEIPAIVKNFTENEIMQVALIENIQREDLNAVEEALAYKELINKFGYTQEELSAKIGKSRTTITNSLRLLNLSDEVLKLLVENKLSAGHARAILSIEDEKLRDKFAQFIIDNSLSVRQAEQQAKEFTIQAKKTKEKKVENKSLAVLEVENTIQLILGTKVNLIDKGKKGGKIVIDYYNYDDLERIMEVMNSEK